MVGEKQRDGDQGLVLKDLRSTITIRRSPADTDHAVDVTNRKVRV